MENNMLMIGLAIVMCVIFAPCHVNSGVLKWKGRETNNIKEFESVELLPNNEHKAVGLDAECDACKIFVSTLQILFKQNKSKDEIAKILIEVCVEQAIQDHRVCKGAIELFKEPVLRIIGEIVFSPTEVCGLFLGDSCAHFVNPVADWNITLPDTPKPPVVPLQPPDPSAPKLRVLQLSDIHVDLHYKAGSNAQCGEPLCCRENDGPVVGPPAGKWGDYRGCDTPTWTLENLFQHLQKNEKFDYILWTGDLPGHDVWNQTRADQLKLQDLLFGMLRQYFPHTPVYSSIGNHESSPVNSFPPDFIKGNDSTHWLYEKLADKWTQWLPRKTEFNINRGAFYTFLLKPGFRIISLNSNNCNNENFWLYLNETDPNGELQWLIDTLQQAEDNKEKVHIIGHIPPGDGSCLKSWTWNYYKIVNRYESTIMAQFYGHKHIDGLEIFYRDYGGEDANNNTQQEPSNVIYVSPSVTTYMDLNPGYRVYTIDGYYTGSTFSVLDHETYILNLTEANASDKPKWELEYSAKAAYNLSSLFPRDWQDFLERLDTDDALLQKYYRHIYKSHKTALCDSACKQGVICNIKEARSHDPDICAQHNVTYEQHAAWNRQFDMC